MANPKKPSPVRSYKFDTNRLPVCDSIRNLDPLYVARANRRTEDINLDPLVIAARSSEFDPLKDRPNILDMDSPDLIQLSEDSSDNCIAEWTQPETLEDGSCSLDSYRSEDTFSSSTRTGMRRNHASPDLSETAAMASNSISRSSLSVPDNGDTRGIHPDLNLRSPRNGSDTEVRYSTSIDSLCSVLKRTQIKKSDSVFPDGERDGRFWNQNSSNENNRKPSARSMDEALSAGLVRNRSATDSKDPESLPSPACQILHKTGRRNLLRMLDYALTEFLLQSLSLTCCIISPQGPLLVHDCLLMAKCVNWNKIRSKGHRYAREYLVVELRNSGLPSVGLWSVMEYVYTGNFVVIADTVFDALKAAEFFGVPVMIDICLRLLNCLTCPKLVCHTIESLRQQGKQHLPIWTLALGKLITCFDECRNEKIMIRWPVDLVIPVLEQPELYTRSEVNVYNFAVRWIQADFANRREFIPGVMNTVRFVEMSAETLLHISSNARIFDGYPDLRQEIADLHLKVRMESSGFEIPVEMDWSIPRRRPRVQTAAKAYAQSGEDISILMLYFCPREPAVVSESPHLQADDSIRVFLRYLKVASNFVLIDDNDALSGGWIYHGPSEPDFREAVHERQIWMRSAREHPNTMDLSENEYQDEAPQTFEDEQYERLYAPSGTLFRDILKFLVADDPQIHQGETQPAVFDATPEGFAFVSKLPAPKKTSSVCLSSGSKTSKFHCSPQKKSSREVTVEQSKHVSPGINLPQPKDCFSPPFQVPKKPTREYFSLQEIFRVTEMAKKRKLAATESTPVLPFEAPPIRDSCGDEGRLIDVPSERQRRWYEDLANKMNILMGPPNVGDQILPAVSTTSFYTDDLNSIVSSEYSTKVMDYETSSSHQTELISP